MHYLEVVASSVKWVGVILLFGVALAASENPDGEFPYNNDLIYKHQYQNKIAANKSYV